MSCNAESHDHDHGDHDHGHDHSLDDPNRGSEMSLWSKIDLENVQTLNEAVAGSGSKVLKPWQHRFDREPYLESDADEQLILFIPFTASVKLKSIAVLGGPLSQSPKTLKAFANRTDIDFDSADSTGADQEFELVQASDGSQNILIEYPTRVSRFSSLSSITLYFPDNFGDDVTRISYIGFKGEYEQFSRNPIITSYEAAANPADHKNPSDMSTTFHRIQ